MVGGDQTVPTTIRGSLRDLPTSDRRGSKQELYLNTQRPHAFGRDFIVIALHWHAKRLNHGRLCYLIVS